MCIASRLGVEPADLSSELGYIDRVRGEVADAILVFFPLVQILLEIWIHPESFPLVLLTFLDLAQESSDPI